MNTDNMCWILNNEGTCLLSVVESAVFHCFVARVENRRFRIWKFQVQIICKSSKRVMHVDLKLHFVISPVQTKFKSLAAKSFWLSLHHLQIQIQVNYYK